MNAADLMITRQEVDLSPDRLVDRVVPRYLLTPLQWPGKPPSWLPVWTIWRFKNRPSPPPAGLPRNAKGQIDLTPWPWVWDYLAWVAWNRAGRIPAKKPRVDPTVPLIYHTIVKQVNAAVPIYKPPPPVPPPPPPPPPPVPVGANTLNYGRSFYVTWGIHNGSLGSPLEMVRRAKALGFTRIVFQSTPDNDRYMGAVRMACRTEGLRFAVWFDVHHPGDQYAIIENALPDEYLLNIESNARGPDFEIPALRADYPDLPLGTITNFVGLNREIADQILRPNRVVFHIEGYRYEPGMDRPDLELDLQNFAHQSLGVAFIDMQLTLGINDWCKLDRYHDYDSNRFGIYPAEYL
jgi:hypothetical protein